MEQILVIDQGTHASRCMIYTNQGQLLAQTSHPVTIYRQNHQIVEQNAEEILASIYYCIDQLQHQHDLSLVSQAALVTQRSTIVGWHKHTGKMLSPAISWQDTRAADILQPLQAQAAAIKNITGLPPSPHYGASKMSWLVNYDENCQQAYQQEALIIAPLACYLIEQLTGITAPVTDHVNAQRTLLFDINNLDWSPALLDKFQLQQHCLPQARPCLSDYGQFRHHEIRLNLVTGDQNAALFAHGTPASDTLLINIGTGGFVLKMTKQRMNDRDMLDGIAVTGEDKIQYLQEGTVNGAGSALALLFNEIDEHDLFQQLPRWLQSIPSPPVFINSVSGLGSPWWNNMIKPHYLDTTAEHLDLPEKAVAILESIVFLLQCNIERLADKSTRQIILSGGLSRLDGLCQKLSDLSQLSIKRSTNTEASATGAAWLLGDQYHWQHKDKFDEFNSEQNIALDQRYQQFKQRLISLTQTHNKKTSLTANT